MFRPSARRLLATTAKAAAQARLNHTLAVSEAQGIAKGLTEGKCSALSRPQQPPSFGLTPRSHRKHAAGAPEPALRRDGLRDPGQGRVHEPRGLHQGPRGAVRGQGRRGARAAAGRRHRGRGHGGQHGHRAGARVPVARLPARHLHAHNPANYNHQARRHAERLDNAVWTNQFDNTANRRAHLETTGPEIWAQTRGRVDAFTCATGTAGTLAGVTRFLKDASRGRVKSFLADPPGSVLHSYVSSGGKLVERTGSSITEGIGQGRITDNLAPDIGLVDGSLHISDDKSIAMVYRCLDEEGLYLGASSALNVVAAKEVAEKLGPKHTVVTVLCDGAYRYAERLFSRKWLSDKKLLDAVPQHLQKYIVLP
ncbi:hypothetical protein HIM_06500 [Hirsutella minnesotensis 3608]|uniref:Tryptophan synthase beta chain-like PALP domain-containing protein n=1 Tax=Hirsutella minnesotensis 3608 TaxID=1043627 RepID=A0A0F7ZIX4_9HYPO|nr:hypothetical protein HIM_06500 [Hirsutella minnesotensis 3608]